MSARTVYLGLGSNLAPRESHLVAGLQAVEEALVERRAVHAITLSPWYETEAWGMPEGTPAFLNLVAAVETPMPLDELLELLLAIERNHGRVRNLESEGYANRTLDLDVLCTSTSERHADERLEVPHPRMMSRRFVLQPLFDLAPHLEVDGQPIGEALDQCPNLPHVEPYPKPED